MSVYIPFARVIFSPSGECLWASTALSSHQSALEIGLEVSESARLSAALSPVGELLVGLARATSIGENRKGSPFHTAFDSYSEIAFRLPPEISENPHGLACVCKIPLGAIIPMLEGASSELTSSREGATGSEALLAQLIEDPVCRTTTAVNSGNSLRATQTKSAAVSFREQIFSSAARLFQSTEIHAGLIFVRYVFGKPTKGETEATDAVMLETSVRRSDKALVGPLVFPEGCNVTLVADVVEIEARHLRLGPQGTSRQILCRDTNSRRVMTVTSALALAREILVRSTPEYLRKVEAPSLNQVPLSQTLFLISSASPSMVALAKRQQNREKINLIISGRGASETSSLSRKREALSGDSGLSSVSDGTSTPPAPLSLLVALVALDAYIRDPERITSKHVLGLDDVDDTDAKLPRKKYGVKKRIGAFFASVGRKGDQQTSEADTPSPEANGSVNPLIAGLEADNPSPTKGVEDNIRSDARGLDRHTFAELRHDLSVLLRDLRGEPCDYFSLADLRIRGASSHWQHKSKNALDAMWAFGELGDDGGVCIEVVKIRSDHKGFVSAEVCEKLQNLPAALSLAATL